MRPGGGGAKGAAFERDICRRLSMWWSGDKDRDDIFWRSSQSGGRATERAKKGKRTFGSYGDIAAVDPLGLPLLKFFTFELKRGRTHGSLGDLMDMSKDAAWQPFEKCMQQAALSAQQAKSITWMLIVQRDRRHCMAYADTATWKTLGIRTPHRVRTRLGSIGAIKFSTFLGQLNPETIRRRIH